MTAWINRFLQEEEGATMAEYALMVALIAAVCIGVVSTLGGDVKNLFDRSYAKFPEP